MGVNLGAIFGFICGLKLWFVLSHVIPSWQWFRFVHSIFTVVNMECGNLYLWSVLMVKPVRDGEIISKINFCHCSTEEITLERRIKIWVIPPPRGRYGHGGEIVFFPPFPSSLFGRKKIKRVPEITRKRYMMAWWCDEIKLWAWWLRQIDPKAQTLKVWRCSDPLEKPCWRNQTRHLGELP